MDADEIYEALVEGEYRRLLEKWKSWNDEPLSKDGEARMRAAARYTVDRA